jgi:competence protein ComEA
VKRFEEKSFLFLILLLLIKILFSLMEESFFQKIDINKATLEELELLPGVGRKIAERIMEYRRVHGGFMKVDEILRIKGIGKRKYERIKDFIEVE